MEDFHFALGAVGDMETDRRIALHVDSGPELTGFIQRAQFEDIVLELVEERGGFAVAEQVNTTVAKCGAVAVGVIVAVQQADVITALLAPGSEQRMGVLVQSLWVDSDGHARFARLAFVFVTQQVLVGDDVRPMMAAGVMHAEQDLAETGQTRQGFQRLGRQR